MNDLKAVCYKLRGEVTVVKDSKTEEDILKLFKDAFDKNAVQGRES